MFQQVIKCNDTLPILEQAKIKERTRGHQTVLMSKMLHEKIRRKGKITLLGCSCIRDALNEPHACSQLTPLVKSLQQREQTCWGCDRKQYQHRSYVQVSGCSIKM